MKLLIEQILWGMKIKIIIFNAAKKKKIKNWTKDEDAILLLTAKEYEFKNWKKISERLKGRSAIQCSARYKRIKPGIVKGAWSLEEDERLKNFIKRFGKNWSLISKYMPTRSGKQIRDRYLNTLDPTLLREKFSNEEDEKIIDLYKKYGSSWSIIAKKFSGRTGDMIKNRFYSSLKKFIINEKINSQDENKENSSKNFSKIDKIKKSKKTICHKQKNEEEIKISKNFFSRGKLIRQDSIKKFSKKQKRINEDLSNKENSTYLIGRDEKIDNSYIEKVLDEHSDDSSFTKTKKKKRGKKRLNILMKFSFKKSNGKVFHSGKKLNINNDKKELPKSQIKIDEGKKNNIGLNDVNNTILLSAESDKENTKKNILIKTAKKNSHNSEISENFDENHTEQYKLAHDNSTDNSQITSIKVGNLSYSNDLNRSNFGENQQIKDKINENKNGSKDYYNYKYEIRKQKETKSLIRSTNNLFENMNQGLSNNINILNTHINERNKNSNKSEQIENNKNNNIQINKIKNFIKENNDFLEMENSIKRKKNKEEEDEDIDIDIDSNDSNLIELEKISNVDVNIEEKKNLANFYTHTKFDSIKFENNETNNLNDEQMKKDELKNEIINQNFNFINNLLKQSVENSKNTIILPGLIEDNNLIQSKLNNAMTNMTNLKFIDNQNLNQNQYSNNLLNLTALSNYGCTNVNSFANNTNNIQNVNLNLTDVYLDNQMNFLINSLLESNYSRITYCRDELENQLNILKQLLDFTYLKLEVFKKSNENLNVRILHNQNFEANNNNSLNSNIFNYNSLSNFNKFEKK